MIEKTISQTLSLHLNQVQRVIALLDEGNTIPFLARYRKEATGGLDEVQLREVQDHLTRLRKLEERREEIEKSIQEQGKLDEALARKIAEALTLSQLEDLYLPFRPKRRTRAMIAKERGLEPLANLLLAPPKEPPATVAQRFLGPEVPTAEDALAGARDILAEMVAEEPEIREYARHWSRQEGLFATSRAKGEDPQEKYSQYYAFSEPIRKVQPHRVLACERGEKEGVLKVGLELPKERILGRMQLRWKSLPPWQAEVEKALEDGYKRLLAPHIERELRSELNEAAQHHAIGIFASNVRSLLLQPPLRGKVILGIDPGFRTGCKVVVVDPTGKPLVEGFAIYPHEPQKRWKEAIGQIRETIERYGVDIVAIGNGTASRETEALVAEAIQGTRVQYTLVSEAGASVYSASEVAREEFPDLDATQRGTISIARRLQDPLAELVKIDPKSIGVGQYQHDLEPKALEHALDGVVEDAVNHVGVELNTASVSLLTHVAGLNRKIAQAIVARRQSEGPYPTRQALKKVKGLGEKTFQQCAGFLRIPESPNPLDRTAIHPESYGAAEKIMAMPDAARTDPAKLAAELGVGVPTLVDIL
ncbi:MAG: Tex-like N-terminal domain-containing protein, partial [Bacteroidota bacterium]